MLTFDNGYASQYGNAMPILKRLGWVGDENIQLSGLPPSQGGLTEDQVRGLLTAGWELDTQGISHADLIALDASQLHYQVATARQILQKRYGVPVNWFCYPSGHYDATVIAAVKAAGFVGSTTVIPGWATPSEDPYRLPRLRVLGGTSPSALLEQIAQAQANGRAARLVRGRGHGVSAPQRMFPVERPGTLRASRPPLGLGIAASVLSVAIATAAIYPLKNIAPAVSLSVVYLPAVLLVSAYWGLPLGLADLAAQRRRVQLLPPPAGRPVHDRRQPQLGGAGRVHAGRRRGEHDGRARAQPRAGGRAPARRGRPGGRAGARAAGGLADAPTRWPRPPAGSPRRSGCARRRSSSA